MGRTPLIAGNWKMNLLRDEAIALARGIRERTDGIGGIDKLVCPPYLFLGEVRDAVEGSSIHLGAQNLYPEEKGAFTGEVSVTQVAEVAEYVIIGHSERRQYFGETDETVNKRLASALAHRLKPIMCVGESLEQRERDETPDVLIRQVRGGLFGLDVQASFVVAYEPVWAIGTGRSADAETAQSAIDLIRRTLRELYEAKADAIRILYGGSVTPENTAELMAQPDIDGGLVGGASLRVDSFSAIIEAAAGVHA
ncbi:MAG TPA: triose-phosphate isomerase [Dehalococcoidia bacterium]|nr:triose-phosphate isomerase [Dehalococcoidia bacterium]